jgi:excisionase family DNA binding protein
MDAKLEVPNEPLTPLLVNRETAASLLAVSLRTIDHLITAGKLPTKKMGRRRLVPYVSLADFAGSKP